MNKVFNIGDLVQSVNSGNIVKVTRDEGKDSFFFAGEVVISTKRKGFSHYKSGYKSSEWIKMFFKMYKPVSFNKMKII
jgi:hypothetical protein